MTRANRLVNAYFVLLAIPLTWWLIRVLNTDWVPHGDLAIAAIKIHDVFSFDPPLLGMPSTSSSAVPGNTAHHPGPLQFYFLALGYRLTGGAPASLLIGSTALLLVFSWFTLRASYAAYGHQGTSIAFVALVIKLLDLGLHSAVPWNPWPAQVASIAAFAAAWAVLQGKQRWWWLFMFASAMAAQSHMSLAPTMVIIGFVLLVATMLGTRKYGFNRTDVKAWKIAALIMVIVWLPPIINQLAVEPGNLSLMLEYSSATGGGTPTVIYVFIVAMVLFLAALRGITLTARKPRAGLPLLVIGLAVGSWSTGRSADGTAGSSYADTAFSLVIAWPLGLLVFYVARRWALASIAAGLILSIVVASSIDSNNLSRSYQGAQLDADFARETIDIVRHGSKVSAADLPIEIRAKGTSAWGGLGPAVCAEFVRQGREVYCGDGWTLGREGDHRHPRHLTGTRTVVLLSSGNTKVIPEGDHLVQYIDVQAALEASKFSVERGEDWISIEVFEESP